MVLTEPSKSGGRVVADPKKYQRAYSFSGYQATNPKQSLPAPRLDDELENIEQSIGEIVVAIKSVRRADGKLQNGSVDADSLDPRIAEQLSGLVLEPVQGLIDAANAASTIADINRAAVEAAMLRLETIIGLALQKDFGLIFEAATVTIDYGPVTDNATVFEDWGML